MMCTETQDSELRQNKFKKGYGLQLEPISPTDKPNEAEDDSEGQAATTDPKDYQTGGIYEEKTFPSN